MKASCSNKLSDEKNVRWIGSATKEELIEHQPQFLKIANSPDSDPSLLIATFRAFLRHRNTSLVDCARHFFFCENPKVAAAAIEYAGELSPEWFVRVSGKLLQRRNLSVYRAAVRTLHRLSPDAAISAIRAMISSKQPAQIKSAVNCMVYLEFSAIRDLATEIAAMTQDEEVFAAIIMLFQNNPESENLFALYQIEKQQKNSDWGNLANQIRRENEQMLREREMIAQISVSSDEKFLEKRLKSKRRLNTPKIPARVNFNSTVLPEQIKDLIQKISAGFLIKCGLISGLIFFLFHSLTTIDNSGACAESYSPRREQIEIVSCSEFQATIRLQDKSEMIVKPAAGKFHKKLLQNKILVADITPYRRDKDGRLVALCTKISEK